MMPSGIICFSHFVLVGGGVLESEVPQNLLRHRRARRSFSRAAVDNGISQSAASQVVSQLEQPTRRAVDRAVEAAAGADP
jgi:hypothetical protein